MLLLITATAFFFAMNMGGSGVAAAFAAPYGSRLLSHVQASFLFGGFVLLGAVTFGQEVAHTLGERLIPPDALTPQGILVIFISASLSMLVANLMQIPQSTSLVTVAAISGVGLFHGQLNWATIRYMVPFWIILPILSFLITYAAMNAIYPPRRTNFWLYEKLVNHRSRLQIFVIVCSCYNAFSVGTNNVANAAGPIYQYGQWSITPVLLVFALGFGAGAFVFTGPIQTAGGKIVPLGLMSASIISLVSSTLMLIASGLGVPQSFVMLQMGALFAVAVVKDGREQVAGHTVTRNTLLNWSVNPLITVFVSWALAALLIR